MDFGAQTFSLKIRKSWNGEEALSSENAELTFSITHRELRIQLEASFHNDPAPPVPTGTCEGLWNYEVVELFLLGASGNYLEIELGPHGHYLIYHLSGIRQVTACLTPLNCRTEISGHLWRGSIAVDLKNPDITPLQSVNAYAVHGQGTERRFLAAFPLPGKTPDFHQPHYFKSLDAIQCKYIHSHSES
jgi:hypothetical protein